MIRTAAEPALPAEPVDTTDLTLAFLRVLRRGQRREEVRSTLYAVYCCLVVGGIWGVPYLAAAARAAHDGIPPGPLAGRLLDALPPATAVLIACFLLAGARVACWRGPVQISGADAAWLLPRPIDRARITLPALRRAAFVTGAAGTVLGAAAGFALQPLTTTPWWATTAGGAWCGGVTALLGTAVRALVQRHQERFTAGGLEFPVLRGGVGVLAVLALCSVAAELPGLGRLLLWSGPWAWPGLPLAAATGRFGDVPAVWVVLSGALLSGSALALTGHLALRAAPGIPARVLRSQSRLTVQLAAALYTFDTSGALSLTRGVFRRRRSTRRRPPPPRARWLLVPWRDLLALLGTPGRLVSAVVWAATAAGALRLSAHLASELHALVVVLALAMACRAASRAAAGAELEGAGTRRSAALPWTRAGLATRHMLLPTAVVGAGVLLGAALCAAAGLWHPSAVALLAAVPACAATALVGAYRGSLPTHLLIGTDTAMGNTGALNVLMWHARGPLVLLSCTAPAYLLPLGAPGTAGLLATVTLGLLWWVRVRARAR